jgi:tryptophan halogenase
VEAPSKQRIVIAGGGTAGWLAAAVLTRQLGAVAKVTLVESEEIATVGVGESTIPTVQAFHGLIGVDEQAFMAATGATFKLGISFENWARDGDRYFHSFGDLGRSTWMADFHHFWLKAKANGFGDEIGDYCLEHRAAESGRFAAGADPRLNYAYHFDAGRYARYLRGHCEANGLVRIEGRVAEVSHDGESGDIASLTLADGRIVPGDLFLDCTGFRALLIGRAMGVGYEDWSHWLPTDRALPVQTAAVEPPPPYTRAIAHGAGWRWRIPLQHRVGNGLIYCSDYLSDDDARTRLYASIEGERLVEPNPIRFRAGRRARAWEKNCVALSLASGFVEPLESTSIHLIMIALTRLLQIFPARQISPATIARFNEQARRELEGVRDFIVLHYHLNERPEPFWERCRSSPIPDSLAERIALFAEAAHAYQDSHDLFRVASWVQVMLGQRVIPRHYHPAIGNLPTDQLAQVLGDLRDGVERAAARLPTHEAFLRSYCPEAAA